MTVPQATADPGQKTTQSKQSGSDKAQTHLASAQEQHAQDDEQRAKKQDSGQPAPRPSDEQAGTVGKEGQEQGTEPPRGDNSKEQHPEEIDRRDNIQEAVKRTHEAIETGEEAPA